MSCLALSALLVAGSCGGGSDGSAREASSREADGGDGKGGGGESAGGGATGEDCKPELEEVNQVSLLTHCGPASAKVTVGGKTLTFEGGKCEHGDGYLAVNVGRQVLGIAEEPIEQHYFGLVAGDTSSAFGGDGAMTGSETFEPLAGDGKYAGEPLVTWIDGTATGSLTGAALTVEDGMSRGTFGGVDGLGGTGRVEGSFDCG